MKPRFIKEKSHIARWPKHAGRKLGMRWHIFGWFLGFSLFIILLLWFFQIIYLDTFYKNIKMDQIDNTAQSIVVNIDNSELTDLLDRLAQSNDICISLLKVRTEGQLTLGIDEVYRADVLSNCIIHHISNMDYLRIYALAEQANGKYIHVFSLNSFYNQKYNKNLFSGKVPNYDQGLSESLLYAKIITNAENEQFLILLNSSISPVNSTRDTLMIQLMYITVIVIALALIMSLLIARYLTVPIARINASAKQLARGNFDAEFRSGNYHEINELSATLNYAAQELSRTERLQKELIANISHDLRTPLTMIGGYAEVMRDIPGENNRENIDVIIKETERLNSLINDVMDISKINSGVVQITVSQYDITADIASIVENYNHLLEHEGYIVDFVFDYHCIVSADQTKISQVITNLLNNALTYTGGDKQVRVMQTCNEGKVRLEICDSGEGIPPEQLPHIWQRYYRGSGNHRRATMGSGLGLSIVRGILEQHHADYGVESELGKGTIFWFELELVSAPQTHNE